jgi:uroporphyrinogen III methyltransferase / synthase
MSKVYLVGAGPGDPELITLKGRRVLSLADSVLYDHLANPALLDLAPASAERLYVGKKRSQHLFTQAEICSLLIERAQAGKTVVRLKGGDPFIFGRGGEEVEALAAAGVPFEVVPGVTAPLGLAAYCGVPLTHRSHTSVVTFLTGHSVAAIDWSKVGTAETLVVFMGLEHIDDIVREVLRNGRAPGTPAMAVRWATRPDQRSVAGRLEDLPRLVHEHGLKPPATLLIGEVVDLREQLGWFEKLPLFGQRIAVTRARAQAGEVVSMLAELGADVCAVPVIELRPVEGALPDVAGYDWVIFTSANAVEFFMARVRASGRDARAIRGQVCAIGTATRDALAAFGITPDLVPDDAIAEGVVEALKNHDMAGKRVLLPRAAEAREVIPEALRTRGAVVDIVDAYRNVVPDDAAESVREAWRKRKPDWITFTSGSTVKNFLAVAPAGSLEGVRVASIGPATSKVARQHGLEVHAESRVSNMEGLVQAIVESRR